MSTQSETIEIYPVKCCDGIASRDIEDTTMKNGRPATGADWTVAVTQ